LYETLRDALRLIDRLLGKTIKALVEGDIAIGGLSALALYLGWYLFLLSLPFLLCGFGLYAHHAGWDGGMPPWLFTLLPTVCITTALLTGVLFIAAIALALLRRTKSEMPDLHWLEITMRIVLRVALTSLLALRINAMLDLGSFIGALGLACVATLPIYLLMAAYGVWEERLMTMSLSELIRTSFRPRMKAIELYLAEDYTAADAVAEKALNAWYRTSRWIGGKYLIRQYELLALRGMSLCELGRYEEADELLSVAISLYFNIPEGQRGTIKEEFKTNLVKMYSLRAALELCLERGSTQASDALVRATNNCIGCVKLREPPLSNQNLLQLAKLLVAKPPACTHSGTVHPCTVCEDSWLTQLFNILNAIPAEAHGLVLDDLRRVLGQVASTSMRARRERQRLALGISDPEKRRTALFTAFPPPGLDWHPMDGDQLSLHYGQVNHSRDGGVFLAIVLALSGREVQTHRSPVEAYAYVQGLRYRNATWRSAKPMGYQFTKLAFQIRSQDVGVREIARLLEVMRYDWKQEKVVLEACISRLKNEATSEAAELLFIVADIAVWGEYEDVRLAARKAAVAIATPAAPSPTQDESAKKVEESDTSDC